MFQSSDFFKHTGLNSLLSNSLVSWLRAGISCRGVTGFAYFQQLHSFLINNTSLVIQIHEETFQDNNFLSKYALEKVQNRAIRWMCGVGPRQQASITELRAKLKWPTLEARRHGQRLTLCIKWYMDWWLSPRTILASRMLMGVLDAPIGTNLDRKERGQTTANFHSPTLQSLNGISSPPSWRRPAHLSSLRVD